jgi:mRNA-degrading endonuclease RelE of RelBE toxin-antitoxin system
LGVPPRRYRIEFGPETEGQLRAIGRRHAAVVVDAVERQLQYEPTRETRNRKPMRPNPLAPWELRIGELRVYFVVEHAPERVVKVRAVGIKRPGNRLFIGGDEVVIGEDPQAD